MGYSERIDTVKSEIDSLITYANGVTGESDISIGDAILTLCNGFGSSGSGVTIQKEYENSKEFNILETTTNTIYTYPVDNLVPTSQLNLYQSEEPILWVLEVSNDEKTISYNSTFVTVNSVSSTVSYINSIDGVINRNQLIYTEYRNSWGVLYRLITQRNMQVYEGHYTAKMTAYNFKNILSLL